MFLDSKDNSLISEQFNFRKTTIKINNEVSMFFENEIECVGNFDDRDKREKNFNDVFYDPKSSLTQTLSVFFKRVKEFGIEVDYNSVRRYNFKNRVKPVYIEIRKVRDTRLSYFVDPYPSDIFIDVEIFPVVDQRINNYWLWCARHIKKLLKKKGRTGMIRVTFFHDYDGKRFFGKQLANMMINLDSNLEPHHEHRLWMN